MIKNKNLVLLLVIVLVLLLVVGYFFWYKPSSERSATTAPVTTTTTDLAPTLTPDERAIIASIRTLSVEISESAITPQSITVNRHDQVQFFNSTADQEIRVTGEGWGNIPLKPEQNMTHSFTEAGTYSYQVEPSGLTGTVVIE